MRVRTSLPFLTLFFFALFACNGTVTGDGGGTGGTGGTSGASTGGTGGTGGTSGASTGGTGGTGSTGGGSTLPACEAHTQPPVGACVGFPDDAVPFNPPEASRALRR